MALIKCPECGRDISDAAPACPHCGYPLTVEKTSQNDRRGVNKTTIIIAALVIILGVSGFFVHRVIIRSSYIKNLDDIRIKMYATAAFAEPLAQLTHDVWWNTIYKKSDRATNKYTVKNYMEKRITYQDSEFNGDFNESLRNLANDTETLAKIEVINNSCAEISDIFSKLQNPPPDLSACYATLNEMYDSFQIIVQCATNPSGSLTSYTTTFREADNAFINSFDKLDSIMPQSQTMTASAVN